MALGVDAEEKESDDGGKQEKKGVRIVDAGTTSDQEVDAHDGTKKWL